MHNKDMSLIKLNYQIAQLGCASCASKIEDSVSRLDGVRQVRLDFATAELKIELDDDQATGGMKEKIQTIVSSIEKDARLVDLDQPALPAGLSRAIWREKTIWRLLTGLFLLVLPWAGAFPVWPARVIWLLAYILLGYDVLWAAGRRIWQRQWFDENFLMGLATLGALAIGDFPEAVAVMLFYQTGEFFQDLAVDHSRRSVKALLAIRPDSVLRILEAGVEEVKPDQVQVGESILIRPGDRVALDSIVTEGQSELDTSALTGESQLFAVGPGTEIRAGSINSTGLLTARVIRPEAESSVSRILQLVEEAAAGKAPTEKFITRFAAYYTPVMVVLALLLAFLPPLILQQPLADWVYKALILLVISCPCALVISIPLGYFAGIGRASANGVLVKGGQYLDKLAEIKTMAWDKTGTLTDGSYLVHEVHAQEAGSELEVLELAALAEHGSSHPLARSILQAWQERGGQPLRLDRISSSEHLPGLGLAAVIDGQQVFLGNRQLLQKQQVELPDNVGLDLEKKSTVLYLAVAGRYKGLLEMSDRLRPHVKKTLTALQELGVSEHVLLSGDQPERVAAIAAEAGMDDQRGGLLPEEKVQALQELIDSGRARTPVAYVGDGINDTPILASSDLAIALGGGSDAALETADIIIVGDDLAKLPPAIRLARKTGRIVRQNITIALGFKLIIFLLALAGYSGIWQAVFADVGVTLLAVLNSLRILRRNQPV